MLHGLFWCVVCLLECLFMCVLFVMYYVMLYGVGVSAILTCLCMSWFKCVWFG